jgi:hypothetical protein
LTHEAVLRAAQEKEGSMQTKGKFILCTMDEFDDWLESAGVSRAISLIQNHHTWSPSYANFTGDNHFCLLTNIEEYHIRERGFDMIAQNLTTFPDGRVAVCRPLDRIPAGIKGANQGGICIEHLGNFDVGGDTMRAEQRATIVAVNALLCRRFGLTPDTGSIVYHHWYDLDTAKRTDGTGNTKSCPGTNFFGGNSVEAAAAGFVPLVRERLATGPVPAAMASPDTPTAVVAVDSLNVRTGPGTAYGILRQLLRGVAVHLHERQGGWCRIAADRQEWVCERYVQQ